MSGDWVAADGKKLKAGRKKRYQSGDNRLVLVSGRKFLGYVPPAETFPKFAYARPASIGGWRPRFWGGQPLSLNLDAGPRHGLSDNPMGCGPAGLRRRWLTFRQRRRNPL